MKLFFVYDTSRCQADEDDPKDAVIYFYPAQAVESEYYLLCCQLVGVAKFLKASFSNPSIIELDKGKFTFQWSGKYLLVLGAESSIQSKILQDQLSFLCGIFCFYHGSISNVLKTCKNNKEDFIARLDLAWSRYISFSQCLGNVLQFSMSALPLTAFKKSSKIVLKANRLLHMCQLNSSVMAGVIYYNSRVLATQLTPQLTNFLSLMSNFNASSPVHNVCGETKNLPPDVELKYVYLSSSVTSRIIKYNHRQVGSRVRIKTIHEIPPLKGKFHPTYQENFSSGSEGDVDSGNCSESIKGTDVNFESLFNIKRYGAILWNSNKMLHATLCCSGHRRLLKKKLLNGRNRNCLKLVHEIVPPSGNAQIVKSEDSGIHPLTDQEKINSLLEEYHDYEGVSVLCKNHANMKTSNFTIESIKGHEKFTSSVDLEFCCSLCSDRISSVNHSALKNWNSEEDMSCSKLFNVSRRKHSKESDNLWLSFMKTRKTVVSSKKPKIQVLKCRSNSGAINLTKTRISSSIESSSKKCDSRRSKTLITTPLSEKYADLDRNDLEKYVLYVQRYGGSTVLLLLNHGYDEKTITYLWNCGFSVLRDIEYNAEKVGTENAYNIKDPFFQIMLYNDSQKVLKEYPSYPSALLTEKRIKESIQNIYLDFQSDENLHMFNFLSAYHSIYASHTDKYMVYYIQPENNSKKIETLSNMSSRAVRRLEKIFKISI